MKDKGREFPRLTSDEEAEILATGQSKSALFKAACEGAKDYIRRQELERVLLGSILLDNSLLTFAPHPEQLQPNHGRILRAMMRCDSAKDIDFPDVVRELELDGGMESYAGGIMYIAGLLDVVPADKSEVYGLRRELYDAIDFEPAEFPKGYTDIISTGDKVYLSHDSVMRCIEAFETASCFKCLKSLVELSVR